MSYPAQTFMPSCQPWQRRRDISLVLCLSGYCSNFRCMTVMSQKIRMKLDAKNEWLSGQKNVEESKQKELLALQNDHPITQQIQSVFWIRYKYIFVLLGDWNRVYRINSQDIWIIDILTL